MRTILMLLMMTGAVVAQERRADPRALEACKKQSEAFTKIAQCLPEADVSFQTLDAFSKLYPPDAQPLKDRCIELNKDSIAGAAACLTSAINDAIKLNASLPENSDLDDPIFQAVRDPSLRDQLQAVIQDARNAYPHTPIWGVTVYYPYK